MDAAETNAEMVTETDVSKEFRRVAQKFNDFASSVDAKIFMNEAHAVLTGLYVLHECI